MHHSSTGIYIYRGNQSLAREASLSGEVDGKLSLAAHARTCYIYVCVPYVHNPESAQTILRTGLKKRKWSF